MNFSQALDAVKANEKIQRDGWNGKGMYLTLQQSYPVNGHLQAADPETPLPETCPDGSPNIQRNLPGQMLSFLIMKTAGDSKVWGEGYADYVPWLASMADLLTDDWRIVGKD